MTRWLVQFGYDGAGFAGWARQPRLRTVEGELRRGAIRCGIAPEESALDLAVASRTDRGVHARANALVLRTDLPGSSLLGALNGIAPDIWALRAAPVPEAFDVRRAVGRWYRYLEPPTDLPLERWQEAAALFEGPVDVRTFGRGFARGVPASRPIRSVTVRRARAGLVIDVRARSFVWGMVRRIVAALRAHAEGSLPLDALRAAIDGRSPRALPLAEPERLVLWEVRHGIPWTVLPPSRSFGSHRRIRDERRQAEIRSRVLTAIAPPGVFDRPRSSRPAAGP